MSDPAAKTIDIDKLAADVGAQGGALDGALADLRKGVTAGFAELVALIKGSSKPMDKPADKGGDAPADKPAADKQPEGGHDEPDGDEPDGDEGGKDDEPKPGYKMEKGNEGTSQFIDATELLLKLSGDVDKLVKGQASTNTEIAKLRAENADLRQAVDASNVVAAAAVAPLYKAMAQMSGSLETIGKMAPASAANRVAARAGLDAALDAETTKTTGIDKVMLVNALRKGVISNDLVSRFNRTGKFDDDEAKNADLVKQVKAA